MNISFMRSLMLGCLIGLLFSAVVFADYHYASHTGSDEYPYTSWETAADSIQEAINATSPHDTVYVGSGQWWQRAAVEDFDSIAIIGRGIDSTFCFLDSAFTEIMTIDYGCLVDGITFRHLRNFICLGSRTYAGVTIRNCLFEGGVGISSAGGPSVIENCVFDSCKTAISIPVWIGDYAIKNNLVNQLAPDPSGWAFYLQVHSAVVRNNIIILPERRGVEAMASGILDGDVYIHNNLVVHGLSGITVDAKATFNNTVYAMGWDPTYGAAISGADSIYNNSVTHGLRGIRAYGGTVNYNNAWGNLYNFLGQFSDSVGNISADPMYVNADSFDFRLQAFSPLIDAGDPNFLDVDGTRSDIGVYGGPFGAFYEYRDLPPGVPDSLAFRVWNDTVYLTWRANHEADFIGYVVHRDDFPGFTPSPFNLIAEPESASYPDAAVVPGETYYYRIASLDEQGNLSEFAPELMVTVTAIQEGMEMPSMTVIESNYPNPFNAATTIVYSVADLGPVPAQINLDIFDILGRKVRSLVDERKEVGKHHVRWDGKDAGGQDQPSGIYFVRISQWGLELNGAPLKMTLVR